MDRIISVDTGSLQKLKNTYEALDYIAKAGYKYFDLSLYWESACDNLGNRDDYINETLRLKKYAEELGLKCIQSHSYFTSGFTKEAIEKRIRIISQDIRITKLMGANLTVVHPIWELSKEENVKFLKTFLPLLEELDMKIAIENVWGAKDDKPSIMCSSTPSGLKELLEEINDPHYVACLDIGHAEMCDMETSALEFIKVLGNKIETLHIHDNDKCYDLHQIPYTNSINFDVIFMELGKSNYSGPINFEVERCYASFPKELYIPVLELLKHIGNHFNNIIEREN